MPSETFPDLGGEHCKRTASGARVVLKACGTRESRIGR